MRSRPLPGRSLVALVAALITLFTLSGTVLPACHGSDSSDETQRHWIEIRGQRVALELALEPAEMERGLGRRDSLAWGHGMLFLYPEPGFHAFWMKDMRFDIDILWLFEGRVVEIAHRVPFHPGGPGPSLRPRSLADRVLEVPSGYAEAHGWRIGDRASFQLALPPAHRLSRPVPVG